MKMSQDLFDLMEEKKIIIYMGESVKFTKDFEYIFSDIKVEYYLSDSIYRPENNVHEISFLNNEDLDSIFVIICSYKKEGITSILKNMGLQYKINYVFAEDLFYSLDEFHEEQIQGRKCAVWGTGDTCEVFHTLLKENNYEVNIDFYIDNNVNKAGNFYRNKQIKHSSEIEKGKDLFIIVASIFYFKIKKQLEEKGFIEEKDFICYSKFENRPSEMLKKTIYDRPINAKRCGVPFRRMTYTCFGAHPCCSTFCLKPIGNPVADKPDKIWNSNAAKIFRLSMINKTYSFCRKDACSHFGKNIRASLDNIRDDFTEISSPELLVLGLDYSCNLKCVSCRDTLKIASGEQLELREMMAESLIESGWLESAKSIMMSVNGEVFASQIDKKILFESNMTNRNKIHIITNGNLLDEEMWRKLKRIYREIEISISIDAATKETYEKIRRGGNWNKLMTNLEMLSRHRKSGEIKFIDIRMVVQKENYKEMISFVQMGKNLGFDKVFFSRILNWGTYPFDEFEKITMIDHEKQCCKIELNEIMKDSIFTDAIVDLNDFYPYML